MQQRKIESNQKSMFRIENIGYAEKILADYQGLSPV